MSDGQEGTGVQVLLPANCVRMPVVWFENGFDDHARVCWFCFLIEVEFCEMCFIRVW